MPRIPRQLYHNAMVNILEANGFRLKRCGFCKLLAIKGANRIYIDVAGKNLPYFGRHGQEEFFWETYIQEDRLTRIEKEAASYGAEGWLAFCYYILDDRLRDNFKTIVEVQDRSFGAKMIKTTEYRKHMRDRAPDTYRVVDLPRKLVLQVACDPEDV